MRLRQHLAAFILLTFGGLYFPACQRDTTQAANANQSQSLWQRLTEASAKKLVVPAGTGLEIRLDDSLSSAQNRSGDTFQGTLEQPVVVKNQVIVPQGARVTGKVIEARASGHLETPGELAVALTSLEVGGKTYDIRTSSYARRTQSHKKRNLAWIGGSTAGGALIGALLGGGKGAAIGAGVGAGGGTAGAYATGKKDVVFPAETMLRFRLDEPVTIIKAG